MKLKLIRTLFTEASTTGELYVDDTEFCFTLELPNRDGKHGSCICAGTYSVVIAWSDRFQRAMPRVTNVPFREGILIHPGNYPHDTEGCILLGTEHDPINNPDFIGDSRTAFNRFFTLLSNAKGVVTLEIIGGALPPAPTVP